MTLRDKMIIGGFVLFMAAFTLGIVAGNASGPGQAQQTTNQSGQIDDHMRGGGPGGKQGKNDFRGPGQCRPPQGNGQQQPHGNGQQQLPQGDGQQQPPVEDKDDQKTEESQPGQDQKEDKTQEGTDSKDKTTEQKNDTGKGV